MTIVKQMEVRSNIKKYFDMAYDGDPVIVPRKGDRNVVIISEAEYSRLSRLDRLRAYAGTFSGHSGMNSSEGAAGAISSGDIKADNLDKLEVINALRDGWNGNGAGAFPKDVIKKVKKIIDKLTIQPEIFPTALNTIQLEYDNSRRDHMEIEIGESDTAEIFIVAYNGSERFESIAANIDAINRRVQAFYG